jgi:type I restriction enzyme S subunit
MASSALAETKSLHVPAAYGEPPEGWTWSRLDNVSEGVFDCPHSTPKFTNTGPFIIRTQDIITGVFRADQAGRVSEETYAERIARVTPSRGDLLYSREGTYFGIAAEVPAKTRVCLGQRMVLIRPDKSRLNFSFLCRWLNSPIMAAHIHGYRDGTVAERLNLPTIRALPILIPPLAEQKAIASILGALDDKIELNRRMNATLEGLARALFQSWFVDFDPVRAKLDGRKPEGMDKATAALFSEHFAHCKHKMLPVGWSYSTIEEVCAINAWTLGKNDDLETLEYIEISEVNRGNIGNIANYSRGEEPSRARRRIRHGDTIISTVRPDRGSYFLALNPPENRVASTGFAVLTPTKVPWSFIHAALTQPEVSDHLGQMADGGAYPAVRPEIIGAMQVAVPNEQKILEAFHRTSAPLFEQAEANRAQSRTLATLRDTLLPKLLSGELSMASFLKAKA